MSGRNRKLLLAFGTIFSLVVVAGLLIGGPSTAAETRALFPLNVRGHIYDPSFNPVAGADVTIESWNGATLVQTMTDTSDVSGLYSVTFASNEWDAGYTISVTADDGSDIVTNSTVISSDAVVLLFINVTMTTAIPEFSEAGLVVVCSAFVLVAAVARRSRGR